MVISLIIGAQSQSGEPFMLFFAMFPILWLLIAGLGVTAVVFHIIGRLKQILVRTINILSPRFPCCIKVGGIYCKTQPNTLH